MFELDFIDDSGKYANAKLTNGKFWETETVWINPFYGKADYYQLWSNELKLLLNRKEKMCFLFTRYFPAIPLDCVKYLFTWILMRVDNKIYLTITSIKIPWYCYTLEYFGLPMRAMLINKRRKKTYKYFKKSIVDRDVFDYYEVKEDDLREYLAKLKRKISTINI